MKRTMGINALCAIVLAAALALCLVACGGSVVGTYAATEVTPLREGTEVSVDIDDCFLELEDDGACTFHASEDQDYDWTYAIEGDTITFDMGAAGIAEGTIKGDTITTETNFAGVLYTFQKEG